jgi:hypothetical protein
MRRVVQFFLFKCNSHLVAVRRQGMVIELHSDVVISKWAGPGCNEVKQSILKF